MLGFPQKYTGRTLGVQRKYIFQHPAEVSHTAAPGTRHPAHHQSNLIHDIAKPVIAIHTNAIIGIANKQPTLSRDVN